MRSIIDTRCKIEDSIENGDDISRMIAWGRLAKCCYELRSRPISLGMDATLLALYHATYRPAAL